MSGSYKQASASSISCYSVMLLSGHIDFMKLYCLQSFWEAWNCSWLEHVQASMVHARFLDTPQALPTPHCTTIRSSRIPPTLENAANRARQTLSASPGRVLLVSHPPTYSNVSQGMSMSRPQDKITCLSIGILESEVDIVSSRERFTCEDFMTCDE